MSRSIGDRIRKKLHEAEGYLDLDLPRHSLRILEGRSEWPGLQFEACLLKGEALTPAESVPRSYRTSGNRRGPSTQRQQCRPGFGLVLQAHQSPGTGH